MTAQPPDSDPPQTSGVAEHQPPNTRRMTPSGVPTVAGVCIFSVAFIAVAVLLLMKILGAG